MPPQHAAFSIAAYANAAQPDTSSGPADQSAVKDCEPARQAALGSIAGPPSASVVRHAAAMLSHAPPWLIPACRSCGSKRGDQYQKPP